MSKFDKTKVAVWNYRQWRLEPISQAQKEFRMAAAACEGCEKERYSNILLDILDIQDNSIADLKASGLPFRKIKDTYYPVASDQIEMNEKDVEYFNKQMIR